MSRMEAGTSPQRSHNEGCETHLGNNPIASCSNSWNVCLYTRMTFRLSATIPAQKESYSAKQVLLKLNNMNRHHHLVNTGTVSLQGNLYWPLNVASAYQTCGCEKPPSEKRVNAREHVCALRHVQGSPSTVDRIACATLLRPVQHGISVVKISEPYTTASLIIILWSWGVKPQKSIDQLVSFVETMTGVNRGQV